MDTTTDTDLRQRVRNVIEATPDAPWAVAWRNALLARGPVPLGARRPAGLLVAAATDDWEPRLRELDGVRQRIAVLAHLARIADHWGREQPLADDALASFAALEVPPEDLDHVELPVVLAALGRERRLPEGQRVQLTWRNQAGAALAWALGAFADVEDAAAHADVLGTMLPSLPLARPRPLDELREVLAAARAELARTPERSARRSVLIERAKALRWLTEPWWPELSLTPWTPDDTLSPTAAASFDQVALRERMAVLAPPSAEPTLRPGPEVFASATRLLLMDSFLSSAARRKDVEAAAVLLALLREVPSAPTPPEEPGPVTVEDRIWRAAAADALFWATGVLEVVPDGGSDGQAYTALFDALKAGTWGAVAAAAGVRPRPVLAAELARQEALLAAARPGTRAHRLAAERIRGLRWVVETRWPSVPATPWDGSGTPSVPPAAPLGAPIGKWLGSIALVGLTGFLAACGGGWALLH